MEKQMYTAFMYNAPYDVDESTIHYVDWNEDFGGFTSLCGVDGEAAKEYVTYSSRAKVWTEGWRKLRKSDYGRMECRTCHNNYFGGNA